jgi:mRNA interferase MazF
MEITDQTYDNWNEKKKSIAKDVKKIFFKEGEIWWVTLGLNVGEETYGKGDNFRRPVLIFRKLTGSSCVVLPLTSKEKNGSWYHQVSIEDTKRYTMMHQIRMISTRRFESRIGTLPESDFAEMKKAVAELYGLSQAIVTS